MITSLRSHCFFSGCGDDNAWAALKATRSFKSIFATAQTAHCAVIKPHEAGAPGAAATGGAQSWRQGLRSLYCRKLSRAIADALFSPHHAAAVKPFFSSRAGESAAPADLLPASWLQAGLPAPAADVGRLRAAVMKRFSGMERPAPQPPGLQTQSLILDKAA